MDQTYYIKKEGEDWVFHWQVHAGPLKGAWLKIKYPDYPWAKREFDKYKERRGLSSD